MESIKQLKELLDKQIMQVVNKGDITPVELKSVGDAVDILKDIETICAMAEYGEEEMDAGYSGRRYSRARRSYEYPMMYRDSYNSYDDMSYAMGGQSRTQGGQSNARSRDNYSRHTEKEEMIRKLERMMDEASSEKERMSIMECIEKLERG